MGVDLHPSLVISTAVILVGALLHIVGMATPEWTVAGPVSFGPWKVCGGGVCRDSGDVVDTPSEWEAVQAFTLLGCLASLTSLAVAVALVVVVTIDKCHGVWRKCSLAAHIGAFVGCVCNIIGVVIWLAEIHTFGDSDIDLGYSVFLSLVGGIIVEVGGATFYFSANRIVKTAPPFSAVGAHA